MKIVVSTINDMYEWPLTLTTFQFMGGWGGGGGSLAFKMTDILVPKIDLSFDIAVALTLI